jgi:hypothetical protein
MCGLGHAAWLRSKDQTIVRRPARVTEPCVMIGESLKYCVSVPKRRGHRRASDVRYVQGVLTERVTCH